jgi:outer membrane protein OmpA-like peptidoglycan-associated protein
MKRTPIVSLVVAALAFLTGIALAQDAKTLLFQEADKAMAEAKAVQADFFSPGQFKTAVENYQKADEDFKAGKNMEDIKKKIKMSSVYFLKAVETTQLAQTAFKDCIKARNDALLVESPKLRQALWTEAESTLGQASKQLEDGDESGAKGRARKAERLYRQCELEAIKANYLDGTRALLKQAEEKDVKKRAPETLARAKNLADRSESQLVENRYDTDEARQLAQEAQYEAKHALTLNETIAGLQQSKASLESMLLEAEKPVRRISDAFDLNAKFDQGVDVPVNAVLGEIRKMQQTNAAQAQRLEERDEQIAALKDQVARMESQLGDLKSEKAGLAQQMDQLVEQQRLAREKLERVEKIFTPEEAQILRSGNHVILRLYSITFPSGKSTIEPKYFGLLAKVNEAFKEYPNAAVTVEGHTDSRGSDEANLKLSTERAEAVREYLLATGGVDASRITAAGFGESKPIASNDTEEGRRKNRRIDVVIMPKE